MKRILIFMLFALAVPGCKKEVESPPPEYAQHEQRWLRIYRDGVFEDSVNVSGWEVNEDVVELAAFYYPWQGEDSIDSDGYGYAEYEGHKFPWIFLRVNDKLVGVNADITGSSTVPNKEDIITITYEFEFNIESPTFFPNLVGLDIPYGSLKTVTSRYPDLRLYVHVGEVTRKDLYRLGGYRQIRMIELSNSNNRIGAWDLLLLCRLRDLRILIIHRGENYRITEENVKYLYRLMPKLRQIKLTPVTILI